MGMGSGNRVSYQPQSAFGGKGGGASQIYQQLAQTPAGQQAGMGGKGKGGAQQQQPQVQQPIQQTPYQQPQQNPYAQQYYQPQFRPQTFNNPYAQGGFGQQMGGMGGKGGQIQQFLQQQPQPQGGYGMKGGHRGWEGRRQQNMNPNPQYNMPQNQGLAALTPAQALTQPTATTQALTPEQPYMGNYLQ